MLEVVAAVVVAVVVVWAVAPQPLDGLRACFPTVIQVLSLSWRAGVNYTGFLIC